jgi:hypothetical protein
MNGFVCLWVLTESGLADLLNIDLQRHNRRLHGPFYLCLENLSRLFGHFLRSLDMNGIIDARHQEDYAFSPNKEISFSGSISLPWAVWVLWSMGGGMNFPWDHSISRA